MNNEDKTVATVNAKSLGSSLMNALIIISVCLSLFNTGWIAYTMSHRQPDAISDMLAPTTQTATAQPKSNVLTAQPASNGTAAEQPTSSAPTAAEITQSGCLELKKAMDSCAQEFHSSTRTDSCVSGKTKAANVDTTYCNEDGTVRDVPYNDAILGPPGSGYVTPASSYSTAATAATYTAVISCGVSGFSNINVLACFAGNPSTELELTNGSDYGLYKSYQISSLGQTTARGLEIKLHPKFKIKVQNSAQNLILGVRIISDKTGEQVFGKQVSKYEVINISN